MWIEFIIFIGLLIGLLMAGMWVPFAIGTVGTVILYYEGGLTSFRALGLITWSTMTGFTLIAIPLFIFMAEILSGSGIGRRFYDGMSVLVRRLPGGLLQTNVLGCAMFAAISGSSVATAASIGSIALPNLQERNYDLGLSCGSLAAGGTLGILIPPSITMIIYGTLTETSIAKLFMAGIVPGFLLVGVYVTYIAVRALINPALAPRSEASASRGEIIRAVVSLSPLVGLMLIVLGGIYMGITTPTESAAVGCVLSLLICAGFGRMNWTIITTALANTVKLSTTMLFIIHAAIIFSYGVELAGIGEALIELVIHLGLGPIGFLMLLIVIFLILGCFLDGAGMIVLTVPLLLPVIRTLGVDVIWFGVFIVLMLELGMLSPPFGLNLFVVQGISGYSFPTVVFGVLPFILILLCYAVFLILFPGVALWLPGQL